MKIAIASDHAGYELKSKLISAMPHIEWIDFGTHDESSMDYPDTGKPAALSVSNKETEKGILICGSGIGMSIAANKVPGIRAALCITTDFAKLSRMHNDANVLVLPGRFIALPYALEIIELWLATPFEGGRHQNRLNKIENT